MAVAARMSPALLVRTQRSRLLCLASSGAGRRATNRRPANSQGGPMRLVRPPRQHTPEVSVVVPLFNEQENLPELFRRLVRTLEGAGIDFELVFVDDGSRDGTSTLLQELHGKDPRVMVISLSRNFGHQPAI